MSKNYYQVAVLIDAGYLLHKAYHPLGKRLPTAEEIRMENIWDPIERTDQRKTGNQGNQQP